VNQHLETIAMPGLPWTLGSIVTVGVLVTRKAWGVARGISRGPLAVARDRYRRKDRVQHFAFRRHGWGTAWAAVRKVPTAQRVAARWIR
jgi:hypothetical protein